MEMTIYINILYYKVFIASLFGISLYSVSAIYRPVFAAILKSYNDHKEAICPVLLVHKIGNTMYEKESFMHKSILLLHCYCEH